ncbi:MAG: ferrous iron transport protein B [bacterium]
MRVALVGQPNCGKSTLFNSVAGYKAIASNFPGTSVDLTVSRVSLNGLSFDLVDLPGIYSLSSVEPDELVARDYLLKMKPDAVINILDASLLGRSLELTLELLELKVPLIVCLNMMDEAERKGIRIDVRHLEEDLGVPTVPTIASRGQGIPELFEATVRTATAQQAGRSFYRSRDVENAVAELSFLIGEKTAAELGVPSRLLGLKLLEGDEDFQRRVRSRRPEVLPEVERLQESLSYYRGRPADVVLSSERHSLALNLLEHVTEVKPRVKPGFLERLDSYLLHPILGYLILGLILFGFFNAVFGLGRLVEQPVLSWFGQLSEILRSRLDQTSLGFTLAEGLIQGFSGGIGIVLPYLVPFLLGLSLLEDIGYLPRAAFLMDTIMHRIGLHGKAVIPMVLGYGCNVPAIMSTRTLGSTRDRFITAVLVTFVPCAARTTIIFSLVAFYLGPSAALFLYLLNLVVIAAVGKLLSILRPELSPGLILEIPSCRLPRPRAVASKIWFRLREFVVIAWPILIVGSVVLGLLEHFDLFEAVNRLFAPFTRGLLGLPAETSITLIFGILRKELTIIMLVQALGTSEFASVMSHGQMMVFTVFSLFYIPCLATLAMLRAVIGLRGTAFALLLTTAVATGMALLVRFAYLAFG